MNWNGIESRSKSTKTVTDDAKKSYDQTKEELAPVLASEGTRVFQEVIFQQIRGPSFFEAEFGKKGDDLIVHVWPDGYRKAEEGHLARPRFKAGFETHLKDSLSSAFDLGAIEWEFNDTGSYFLKLNGAAMNPAFFDACVKVFSTLYDQLSA